MYHHFSLLRKSFFVSSPRAILISIVSGLFFFLHADSPVNFQGNEVFQKRVYKIMKVKITSVRHLRL